ncbi:MAG TPA: UDP-N-acetylmuramate dehydrogenase [Candidatus Dormibacteraeota bacterium]|nr:UDP-N-acetylmuramate dehydrogenase [Candidatus Dormibacteraeota bacterium]
MTASLPRWVAELPGVRLDEPVARHSQFGVGGPADAWVRLPDGEALATLLRRASADGLAVTVLGAGSNTLVLDGGIRGLCVEMADRHLSVVEPGRIVELGGGAMMPRAALDLARLGLAGLEFGIGIPGTCGASVRGNAGAFGREIADVLVDCDLVAPDGRRTTAPRSACAFSYRRSALVDGDLRGHAVVAARFAVEPGDPVEVRARVDGITARRKAAQPWGRRSLGSVFKNPPSDHAGRLVEACGLKGSRLGGAEISRKHANFILNADHATAADVLGLVRLAHDTVLERFGVDLDTEIVVVGEAEAAA